MAKYFSTKGLSKVLLKVFLKSFPKKWLKYFLQKYFIFPGKRIAKVFYYNHNHVANNNYG
jgi:hypothetical protein